MSSTMPALVVPLVATTANRRSRSSGDMASRADAGAGTADYILAHRIPGVAKRLMRLAPPPLAARMLSAMNTLDTGWPDDMEAALGALPEGHAFTVPDVLFAKISDEEREEWQARFAGTRT